jgi:hypothetical protein
MGTSTSHKPYEPPRPVIGIALPFTGGFILGAEWPGREAHKSSPSSAEAKNSGAIPPLLHMFSWRIG